MPSYKPRKTVRQWLIQVDKDVRRELRAVVEVTSSQEKTYLEGVTSDWDHKVQFRRVMTVTPALIRATVVATGSNKKIFQYVDQGTGKYGPKGVAYKIKATNAPNLKFKGSYDARTLAPAGKGSAPRAHMGEGKATGGWVSKKEITHPGIRPRKFAEGFEQKLQPNFRRRVNNAIRRAARRN